MIGPLTTLDEFIDMNRSTRDNMSSSRRKSSRFGFKRQLSEEPNLVLKNLMADSSLSLFSLHDAVAQGNTEIVRKYEQNPQCSEIMNLLNDDGLAPLHISARLNDVKTAAVLIELGAKPNVHGKEDITPLHIAVRYNCLEMSELLVQRGADINSPTTEGFTPLHMAAKRSYSKLLEVLLISGCTDVNARDSNDNTALHYACSSGKSEVVQLFLKARADVLPLNMDKRTALHCATYLHGNVDILKMIIQRVNDRHIPIEDYVNRKDFHGDTALHLAAENGYTEAVETLLTKRANVNAVNNEHRTPLHLAATGGYTGVVQTLLSHNAIIHSHDEEGKTPLHSAAMYGHLEVIKLLLGKGSKVNALDNNRMSPVMCALQNSRMVCAEQLINSKADLNIRSKDLKTCLHFATDSECEQCLGLMLTHGSKDQLSTGDQNELTPLHYAAMKQSSKILGLLLEHAQTAINKDYQMRTILHIAVEYSSLQCVQLLCEKVPVLINEVDYVGCSPLHTAATHNRRKITLCLLKHGAHLTARDDNRQTPVHYAAKHGNTKVLDDMIQFNAPLESCDNSGQTALHTAVQHGQHVAVQMLIDSGADVLARDDEGLSCLDIAIENQDSLIATKIVKHKRGNEILNICGNDGERPIKKLIEKLPDVADTVMSMKVEKSPLPRTHPDFTITYDFWLLDPGPDDESNVHGQRFFAPRVMAKYKREKLLNHPLCMKLLKHKWRKFGKAMYFTQFTAYFLFLISFIVFIVLQRDQEWLGVDPEGANSTQATSTISTHAMAVKHVVCSYLFVFALFHLFLELLQIFVQRLKYLQHPTKIINWTTYVTSILFVVDYVPHVSPLIHVDPDVRWTCGVISSFLGFIGLLLFLQNASFFGGVYISMFFDVFKTMTKVLGLFILFICGFSVVFHILLKEQEAFETLGLSMLKVLDMTIGEMDFISLFIDSEDAVNESGVPLLPYPLMSRIFFVIFCLMMPIILMNLLVGLAVGDIDTIRQNAKLHRLQMQVNFLYDIETKYPLIFSRFFYRRQLTVKPNQTDGRTCSCCRQKRRITLTHDSDIEDSDEKDNEMSVLQNELRKQKQKTKAALEMITEQQLMLHEVNEKVDKLVKILESPKKQQQPQQEQKHKQQQQQQQQQQQKQQQQQQQKKPEGESEQRSQQSSPDKENSEPPSGSVSLSSIFSQGLFS